MARKDCSASFRRGSIFAYFLTELLYGPTFSIDSLISLLTLTVLEIVLGIDNVIFVSILIRRLPAARQREARRAWMIAGILIRSLLLLALGWLVARGNKELFSIAGYGFSIRNLIMLVGGLFLLYKTVREIHEKFEGDEADGPVVSEITGAPPSGPS